MLCVAALGVAFVLALGSLWDGSAPSGVHLVILAIAVIGFMATMLAIALFPATAAGASPHAGENTLNVVDRATGILHKLSAPAAILDDDATVIVANRMFLTELGMHGTSDPIAGMPVSSLVHPGDHQALATLVAAGARGVSGSDTAALRMLCVDGASLPVHVSLSPLREEGKSNLGLLQFSVRPPHRAAAGEGVDDQDYRSLIDRIAQVVFRLNSSGELIFLNSSWAALLDHTVEEGLGKPLVSFVHPEDKALVEAHINVLTRGKRQECHLEARLIGRNGTSHWTELRARSLSPVKGEKTSIIGTLTDVSRMKRTEAGLRANRRSLSTLLSNIPGMVYRCKNDRNWSFEFTSDGCVDVTGYEPYEIVGDPKFSYMEIIHPDDRAFAWESVRQQVMLHREFQFIYRIINRAGNVVWVWEKGKGVFSSTGELLALEGFITAIGRDGDDELIRGFQRVLAQPGRPRT